MRRLDVAITGFGNVGRCVADMLESRRSRYRERFGADVRITGVCGANAGLIDPDGLSPERLKDRPAFTPRLSGDRFMSAVTADVLIEAGPSDYRTGGTSLGYIREALDRPMHTLVVSKGALVVDLRHLRQLATKNGVSLRFSGATAAALPTVDLIEHNLAGTKVLAIEAVLTGTATFILNQMLHHGVDFEEAVRLAQDHGIAEPDPAFDVDGWDTASKLIIIANSALGMALQLDSLPREGLGSISRSDIEHWKTSGVTPRLIGFVERQNGSVRAGVELRQYPSGHPFAGIQGSMKAVRVLTEDMGELTVLGGASSPTATAAAVLKDLEHVLSSSPGWQALRLARNISSVTPDRDGQER